MSENSAHDDHGTLPLNLLRTSQAGPSLAINNEELKRPPKRAIK